MYNVKKIKNSVKSAVKYINNFEQTVVDIAIENNFDYVVCGHIHQPKMEYFKSDSKGVTYLNSGDWIENLTALEYHKSKWIIYKYDESAFVNDSIEYDTDNHIFEKTTKEIFNELLSDFKIVK